jgi:hypothetical protein
MHRDELGDLAAFLSVAEERSFTRAAARLGTSQSVLSYTVRRLEERLGVRLLTRTTRSVVPTEAGERLVRALGPAFDTIDTELATLSEFRQKPAGTIRITAGEHSASTLLWPALERPPAVGVDRDGACRRDRDDAAALAHFRYLASSQRYGHSPESGRFRKASTRLSISLQSFETWLLLISESPMACTRSSTRRVETPAIQASWIAATRARSAVFRASRKGGK